jgi:hypothetical protein
MLSPPLLLDLVPIRVYGSKSCYSSNLARKGSSLVNDRLGQFEPLGRSPVWWCRFQFLRQLVSFDWCGHCWFILSQAFGITLSLGLLTD